MRNISILSLLLFFTFSVYGSRTEVTTASEIKNGNWNPGDTIVMLDGIWTDQSISFKANGTADNPVVLMAETPGEVVLNGSSKLGFSGKHIIVTGLYFKDGDAGSSAIISFRTSSATYADSCRVTNTTIENYNPTNYTTDSKWVSLYGKDNMVDHCSFVNKTNQGTLLVVWLHTNITPNHIIDKNYFGYRNPNLGSDGKELNGQEIIRIGDSSHSLQNSGCVVSNNFFEHCNGEIEIISNKSCENVYTNNVFFECVGMLTLRHGDRCTVEGNYFFGNGISNTGGVRIIGEDHKVYNNYFENLRGSGYRAALCMVRGKENSALNEYFQVKNAEVMFNTMVNCKQGFHINYNSSFSLKLPPIGCTIAHNHIYNTSASYNNVYINQVNVAEMDVTWKNNLMNEGTYIAFPYTPEEVIDGVDPSMALAGTSIEIYEPLENSALGNYSTNDYSDILIDLRGRNRDTIKIPGTSQLTGIISREMPEKSQVGADFYLPTSVKKIRAVKDIDFDAYASRQIITTKVSEPGTLAIYNISGKCLLQKKMVTGTNTTSFSGNGIFILRYQTEKGEVVAKKIVCNSN